MLPARFRELGPAQMSESTAAVPPKPAPDERSKCHLRESAQRPTAVAEESRRRRWSTRAQIPPVRARDFSNVAGSRRTAARRRSAHSGDEFQNHQPPNPRREATDDPGERVEIYRSSAGKISAYGRCQSSRWLQLWRGNQEVRDPGRMTDESSDAHFYSPQDPRIARSYDGPPNLWRLVANRVRF